MRSVLLCVLATGLIAAGCAGPGSETVARMEANEAEVRDEIEALKRAVEASYDRERAMAERLRLSEETDSGLRNELNQHSEQLAAVRGRVDTLSPPRAKPVARAAAMRSQTLDVDRAYREAREQYGDRQYEMALGRFTEILVADPQSSLADNAQYWIGECYYGLGKFRQALTEFTKIFAYDRTEKADDAQLKIARCYLSLGEKDEAVSAFEKLLDEYPESEYVGVARKEMHYLQAP